MIYKLETIIVKQAQHSENFSDYVNNLLSNVDWGTPNSINEVIMGSNPEEACNFPGFLFATA